jgi:hypothetical protein
MATITVLVKRNPVVVSYRVILTDQPKTNTVLLATRDFKPYTGADPAYANGEVATVPGFNPSPAFTAELDIYGSGGMSAIARFAIDGKLLADTKILKADEDQPSDTETITP